LIDSVLEQKKEDSKLIWARKIQDSAQKYNLSSQKLGTARAISHTIVPHPRICSFAAFASCKSYLLVYFWPKSPWFLVEHSSDVFLRA